MSSTYPADLYAATHRGTPGDIEFYRSLCASTRDVLELGCGYGRVLAALGDVGPRLLGLDLDAELVALAQEHLAGVSAARCEVADMRSFSIDRQFDRVLIPHSGVYCLLEPDDLRATLARARSHLRPGGILALDAYCADAFHEPDGEPVLDEHTLIPVARIEARGTEWDILERSRWNPVTQRILATYVYRPLDGRSPEHGVIDQRYLLRSQLVAALDEAGFIDIAIAGGFDGQPPTEDDDIWVARAVAP